MSRLARLIDQLRERGSAPVLHAGGRWSDHAALVSALDQWFATLQATGPEPGRVIGLQADFSLESIALLLAAWRRGLVVALLPSTQTDAGPSLAVAQASGWFRFVAGEAIWEPLGDATPALHPLLAEIGATGRAGLVIFTSGSSGVAKAALHDVERFLGKFDAPARALRTLALMHFDHVAGMDTLLYTLAAGGSLVVPERRDPPAVCASIEAGRAEVLSASPSFLRLLSVSGAAAAHDLSSLRIITFGSEPMDAATLRRTAALFPGVRLSQKYGTTETGAPRTVPREDDGLWIRLDQPGVETAVRDGVLWLRSDGAFLGYLNASSPFDAQGWYCTGDLVEQQGPWMRVLGRSNNLINVGGEKVVPEAVEAAILELDEILAVVVNGVPHSLLGQIVVAEVELAPGVDPQGIEARVRRHCRDRLPRHAVPVTVDAAATGLVSGRQKVRRRRN